MSEERPSARLHPGGAAAHAIGGHVEDLSTFAVELAERAELHPSAAFVAHDLARLGATGSSTSDRALVALSILLLEALEQGSTRLLCRGPEARAKIAARLVQLGAGERVVRELDALLSLAASEPPSKKSAPLAPKQLTLGIAAPAPARLPEPLLAPSTAGGRTVLRLEGGYLSLSRWSDAERAVARALTERTAGHAARDTVAAILAGVPPVEGPQQRKILLNREQEHAVISGLVGPTTLVTGGPGTGKTSIVVAMLRTFSRLPAIDGQARQVSEIALAAPTGKAADRMREAITQALAASTDPRDRALSETLVPMTLHRLLGYQPDLDRYRHHAGSRLPYGLVVVDEASMLDTMLFGRLVEALAEDALLVLLGDPDQLPSVGAGAVLRDLGVLAQRFPEALRRAHLIESHRMLASDPAGAHVLSVARAVGEGRSVVSETPLTMGQWTQVREVDSVPEGASLFVPPRANALGPWLDRWLTDLRLDPQIATTRFGALDALRPNGETTEAVIARGIHAAHASRLLVITRGAGPRTGLASVNAYLGARFQERLSRRATSEPSAGEPVVVIANDYLRNIYNGDTGIVVEATLEGRPMLALALSQRGRVRLLPMLDVAPLLERAWALTVHRAQGSEHERVALLLPEIDLPRLATREIIYTAITRAKKAVQVVGDPLLLAKAVERKEARSTGLGEA